MSSFITQTRRDLDKVIGSVKDEIRRLELAKSVLSGKVSPRDIDQQTGKRRTGRPHQK